MKRDIDLASFQNIDCYTADELLSYCQGVLSKNKRSEIFYHLNVERCKRCRDLLMLLDPIDSPRGLSSTGKKILEKLKKKEATSRSFPAPMKISAGQIWTTDPGSGSDHIASRSDPGVYPPILIISPGTGERTAHNVIRVIPISFDTAYELEGETLLLDRETPLGYPILLEIFNERPMLAYHLNEFRGSIDSRVLSRVLSLRASFLGGKTADHDKEYLLWKKKELELWNYLSLPVNAYLWDEGETREEVQVNIIPYAKAAETGDHETFDLSMNLLLNTESLTLGVVQVRDKILLRLAIKNKPFPPCKIILEDKEIALEKVASRVYEAFLGYAYEMPAVMTIEVQLEDERKIFNISFFSKW